MKTQQPIFVQSARISAHLHRATRVAKALSLTSKNARAITVRAGQRAAGFIAITDFIETLSREMIAKSEAINSVAVQVSRIATEQIRTQMVCDDFDRVVEKAAGASHLESVYSAIEQAHSERAGYRKSFNGLLNRLTAELEDGWKLIRTANMLVSTAKVEASQVGGYRAQFETIAENLEHAANEIQQQLNTAEQILSDTRIQDHEKH